MNKNKIGLEAEFFLRDRDGKLVMPAKFGFETDDFSLLGEFRCKPGETRCETIGNFFEEFYRVSYKAKEKNLILDVKTGFDRIDPVFYAEILRSMGSKSIAQCQNIYNTDILSLTDAEAENGKIIKQKVSIGLHIHFSSEVTNFQEFYKETYEPVKLPFSVGGAESHLDLYRKTKEAKTVVTATANKINKPTTNFIVKTLDEILLQKYVKDMPTLKYRNPGFYEIKSWGFEYRSLPFNEMVLKDIDFIVDESFKLLESL